MKLISCKIENFGMLHGVEHAFDAPLHVIEAENGSGKSTLAAFLKAMLYGLEGKGRSIEDNERKRYMPWQGGRFGGSLVFAAGGHVYRAERFFGQTPKGDTFALYDAETNLPSTAYSSSLGEELFGIDGEAFSRTTFFTWRAEEKSEANNSIHAKLGGLLDATDDIGDFDAAIARLDSERKFYEKRGNAGKLAELEQELYELSLSIQRATEAEAQVKEKTDGYAACVKEKEEAEAALLALRAQMKEKQQRERRRGVAMQLLRYEKDMGGCDIAIGAARATLGGVDAPADVFAPALEKAKEAYHAYTLAVSRAEDHGKEIAAAKNALDSTATLPDDEAFAEVAEAVTEYTALLAKDTAAAEVTDTALQAAKQAMLEAETAHLAYRTAEDTLRRAEQAITPIKTQNAKQKPKARATLLAVLGTCLLLASVLGIVLLHSIPLLLVLSVLAAIAAAVLLAVGIHGIVKAGRVAALAEAAYKEYELAKREADDKARVCESHAERLRIAVSALTGAELLDGTHSADVQLTWARTEIARAEVASVQAETQSKRLAMAKQAAETALAVYPQAVGDTPTARLSALREALAQYKENKRQLAQLLQRAKANNEQAEAAKAEVDVFLSRFSYTGTEALPVSLQAVENARRDYDEASARRAAIVAERAQYLIDEGITEADMRALHAACNEPMDGEAAFEGMEVALRERIDGYKAQLYQTETEIEGLRAISDELPYLRARLDSLRYELGEAIHTRDLVALTKGFLEEAKTELSTRYLRTMEAHFLKYFRMVAPKREEDIVIDANLSPSVEIGGTRYPVEAFSHGLRDLLGLCMRLALTESMYEESDERPPLVLDDPFVNLDCEKLSEAKGLLDTLCERYQILYFTCHESRNMK